VPEAARLLRAGGRLSFLRNSTLSMLCVPDLGVATDRLLRPQAGLQRMSWESDPGVEFHLGHGDWIRVLRSYGFEVEDLIEMYAPPDAQTDAGYITAEWAKQWPVERPGSPDSGTRRGKEGRPLARPSHALSPLSCYVSRRSRSERRCWTR
jgi:hypothetical protein